MELATDSCDGTFRGQKRVFRSWESVTLHNLSNSKAIPFLLPFWYFFNFRAKSAKFEKLFQAEFFLADFRGIFSVNTESTVSLRNKAAYDNWLLERL